MAREKHQASQKENKQLSLKVDELERLEALGSDSVLFLGPETCSRSAALGLVCWKVLGRPQRKSCPQRSGKHWGREEGGRLPGVMLQNSGVHVRPHIGPPVGHTLSNKPAGPAGCCGGIPPPPHSAV